MSQLATELQTILSQIINNNYDASYFMGAYFEKPSREFVGILADDPDINYAEIEFDDKKEVFISLSKNERFVYVDENQDCNVYRWDCSFNVNYKGEKFVATVGLKYNQNLDYAGETTFDVEVKTLDDVMAETIAKINKQKALFDRLLAEKPLLAYETLKDLELYEYKA